MVEEASSGGARGQEVNDSVQVLAVLAVLKVGGLKHPLPPYISAPDNRLEFEGEDEQKGEGWLRLIIRWMQRKGGQHIAALLQKTCTVKSNSDAESDYDA